MVDLAASLETIAGRIRDHVDALADEWVDVGTDPRTLRIPGVLVQLTGFDVDTLAGYTVTARAVAVANQDDTRALDQLTRAVAPILAADLEVTGPAVSGGITFPANPTLPLPALFVPVQIHESE